MANGKPFGEITSKEKDSMSHRGKALRLMSEQLKNYYYGVKYGRKNDKQKTCGIKRHGKPT